MRYVNTEKERPRWRLTLNYRLLNRLQVGVEYNPAASEISPLFSLFLFTETDLRPALFLGTSSDRIGSPTGEQAYFLTAAKRLSYLPVSVYGTVNYSEWDGGLNFPFGATVEFGKGFSVRGMYDGKHPHLMFNYFYKQHGVSLMYITLETFGIARKNIWNRDVHSVLTWPICSNSRANNKKGEWKEPFA